MFKSFIGILGILLIFAGSISGIVSLIYFAAELINGVGFLAAAWSGIKVFGIGILSFVTGFVFLAANKSMK